MVSKARRLEDKRRRRANRKTRQERFFRECDVRRERRVQETRDVTIDELVASVEDR